jgi:protein-disulfide isomerase
VKARRLLIAMTAAASSIFFTSATASTATTTATTFTPSQVKELHKIIYNYVVNNPEVLVAASEKLRQKAQAKEQAVAMGAIKANTKEIFNDPHSPVAGNPKGDVTLVEFFDYQCGHCKAMEPVVENIMASNKNLRVVYKELPIFGGASQYAAKAALAANMQGKYQAFHQALMKAKNPMTKEKVMAIAKKVGLDTKKLKKDMDSNTVENAIKADFALAQKLQLMGTPAFIIGNKSGTDFKFMPGAVPQATLQKAIAAAAANN